MFIKELLSRNLFKNQFIVLVCGTCMLVEGTLQKQVLHIFRGKVSFGVYLEIDACKKCKLS